MNDGLFAGTVQTEAEEKGDRMSGYIVPFAIVIISSLWVMADASKNRVAIGSDREYTNNAPALWFICCLLLWIIAFPFYLIRRSDALRAKAPERPAGPPAGGVDVTSKYCSKCGMQLPAQAVFCSRCGSEQ